MKNNPLQFAVVREDPLLEAHLIERYKLNKVLMVCSGGCTLLSLKALFPTLEMGAFDLNPFQIEHTKQKLNALLHLNKSAITFKQHFNIEDSTAKGLNQCGNFESLFRSLRQFIDDFILSKEEIHEMFTSHQALSQLSKKLIEHRFWQVAFSLFFSDSLLRTLFGEAAIQHAPLGSYPQYFQGVFENGLQSPTALSNYFLHHVFLGHYLDKPEALPPYLMKPISSEDIQFHSGELSTVPDLQEYELIQLSNLMDWMNEAEIAVLGKIMTQHTKSGTLLLIRQLNNHKKFLHHFPDFYLDQSLSGKLYNQDKSLFYSQILCLKRK